MEDDKFYRCPSPIPVRDSTVFNHDLEDPCSGLKGRPEHLNPICLTTFCADGQFLGNVGNLPPEFSFEDDDASTNSDHEVEGKKTSIDNSPQRECVYPVTSSGTMNWGLHFDADFECGNLARVESVPRSDSSTIEYDLFLNSDPVDFKYIPSDENSYVHAKLPYCQWFFFRVQNTRVKQKYRFNLCNFSDSCSPFEFGLRPIMLSEKAEKDRQEGWKRVGDDCSYYRRKKIRLNPESMKGKDIFVDKFVLSFTLEFEYSRDSVYFALQQPYSFTQLQTLLQNVQKDSHAKLHFRRQELCRSLAGNRVDLLLITQDCNIQIPKLPGRRHDIHLNALSIQPLNVAFEEIDQGLGLEGCSETTSGQQSKVVPKFIKKMQDAINKEKETERKRIQELYHEEVKKTRKSTRKPAIVILARLKACDTISSYVCDGIIRFLLSEHPDAVLLRSFFIFYIVPMVNVDGAVNGLSKTDISGQKYKISGNGSVLKELHEELAEVIRENRVAGQFYLHSSSLKQGAFLIDHKCHNDKEDIPSDETHATFSTLKLSIKRMAFSLAHRSCIFNSLNCSFQDGACNESVNYLRSTSAIVCISSFPSKAESHFCLESCNFTRFGELLCHSIWDSARTIFFESCFNEIVLRGEAQELINYVSDSSRQLRHSRHLQFKREQRLKDIFFNYTQTIKRSAQLSEDGLNETISHDDIEEEKDDEDYATDEDEVYYKNDFDRQQSNLDKSHILMNSEYQKYKEKYYNKWYSNKFYDSESDSGDDDKTFRYKSLEFRDLQNGYFSFEPYRVVETRAESHPYINDNSLPSPSVLPNGKDFLEDHIDIGSSDNPLSVQKHRHSRLVRATKKKAKEKQAVIFTPDLTSATSEPANVSPFDKTHVEVLLDENNTRFQDVEATQIVLDANTFDYPGEKATLTYVVESKSDFNHTLSIDAIEDFQVLEQTAQLLKVTEVKDVSNSSFDLLYSNTSVDLRESDTRELVADGGTNVIQDCVCDDRPEVLSIQGCVCDDRPEVLSVSSVDEFPHVQELTTIEPRSPSEIIRDVTQDLRNPIALISLAPKSDTVFAELDFGKKYVESALAVSFDGNDQNSPCTQRSVTMQLKRLSRQRGLSGYERSAILKAKYRQYKKSAGVTMDTSFRSRGGCDKAGNGFDITSYFDGGNLGPSLDDIIFQDKTKGLKFRNHQIPQIELNVFPERINSSPVNEMRELSAQLRDTLYRQDNADNNELWVWRKTFISTEGEILSQLHGLVSKEPMHPPPSMSRSSIRAAPLLYAKLPNGAH